MRQEAGEAGGRGARGGRSRLMPLAVALVLAAIAAAVFSRSGTAPARIATVEVRQSGRAFSPGEVTIEKGGIVTFVNDDGDLTHHAYLSDPRFSFDTGDQQPASRTPVTFPASGQFQVLCGIHPKMKLTVVVR